MRKQVGFDIITASLTNEAEKQVFLGRVQRYLDAGWEVMSSSVPLVGGGTISVAVVLAKYEDPQVLGTPVGFSGTMAEDVPAKRGPGRPPKVVEEVAS